MNAKIALVSSKLKTTRQHLATLDR